MKINRIALSALMASTALVPFSAAWGQEADPAQTDDVIVVRYQFVPDDKRVTSEVSSFLSIDDIATTGDGDVAAALGRVTGLSVTDGRFVVVRGLNERYSTTLINGAPLASPEPLRRAVPLDLFPTNLISNVLVQKTFSPEYPGEFGGGLVNIETSALPDERFLTIGLSSSANTESNFQDGLLHDGGERDWLGFEDGTRQIDPEFVDFFNGNDLIPGAVDPTTLANFGRSLPNSELWVVQEGDIGANAGFDVTAGDRYDFDNFSIGVLASLGYDNSWQTQQGVRRTVQTVGAGESLEIENDFDRISTSNIVESNGLFNVGLEIGDHEFQALALVLRSTDKETSRLSGFSEASFGDDFIIQDRTAFFERQVYTYQATGEHAFNLGQGLSVDWRASFSDASRDAPNQRDATFVQEADGRFRNPQGAQGNDITFTRVDDETEEYGIDFELPVTVLGRDIALKAGYAEQTQNRLSSSRGFSFVATGGVPSELFFQRIDTIFADQNILSTRFSLQEFGGILSPEGYRGELDIQAGYVGADAELTPFLRAAVGVRFEDSQQTIDVFSIPFSGPDDIGTPEREIEEDYVLPAVTLTWTFAQNMQARFGYSQTVARPQFRELGPTIFFNTETDERFQGNPFLENTEITNFDARFEWYFARDQFFTAGIFYKDLDAPIVEFQQPTAETNQTSFINAPEASLLGFELEFEKKFDLSDRFSGEFWQNAELFVKANYTFTESETTVSEGDTVLLSSFSGGVVSAGTPLAATNFIEDGQELQGQSRHLANLQLGWDTDEGARTALLINYTGERIRALQNLALPTPDIIEEPPILLDLVHSRTLGFGPAGDIDVRVAVRNLLGDDYRAFQEQGSTTVDIDTYEIGRTFQISLSKSF